MTTVVVFGGAGFLGQRLVHRLAIEGMTVRVAVRHPDPARRLMGFDRVTVVPADVRDQASVAAAIAGANAVVNTVSAYVKKGGVTFEAVHVQGSGDHSAGGCRGRRRPPRACLRHRRGCRFGVLLHPGSRTGRTGRPAGVSRSYDCSPRRHVRSGRRPIRHARRPRPTNSLQLEQGNFGCQQGKPVEPDVWFLTNADVSDTPPQCPLLTQSGHHIARREF